jgi:plastocyanin
MQALSTLFLLPLLPFTLGQGYGTPQDTSSSTAAASTATSPAGSIQTVTVGENGLSFSPNSITAAVGSIIEFHFFAPTHSVAQSSFSSPCAPLSGGTGFFSGTITTSSGQNVSAKRKLFDLDVLISHDQSCH